LRAASEVVRVLAPGGRWAAWWVHAHDLANAVMILGLLLLWHGDVTEAQEKLEASCAIWERIGDPLFPLCYLSLAALRRHDVEAVRSLSGQVLTLAEAAEDVIHVTLAKATMAWSAWRDGRHADVVAIANEALELWEVLPFLIHANCSALGSS
jgi:hypothetical protein